jgi:hypothetical protein
MRAAPFRHAARRGGADKDGWRKDADRKSGGPRSLYDSILSFDPLPEIIWEQVGQNGCPITHMEPPRKIGRYIGLALLLIIVGTVSYILLGNFPEERAVSHFLTVLEEGNYREAYRLWQPSSTYTYRDFLHDWGDSGNYGKIRTFKILGSQSKGDSTVIVTLTINNEQPALDLVVDRETRGLAFSPF